MKFFLCLIFLAEEFKNLDWISIYKVMRKPAWVFDTRICLDREKISNIGFKVWTLGISF